MDDLDKSRELMADVTGLLEHACEASVAGQSAQSTDEIKQAAAQIFELSIKAITLVGDAVRLIE